MADEHGHETVRWRCHTILTEIVVPAGLKPSLQHEITALGLASVRAPHAGLGAVQAELLLEAGVEPDVREFDGNLMVYGGASLLWECVIGNGTTTAGQPTTLLSNARAAIGVGDSTTAPAATQTNLQAATNKIRVGMDAGYPLHVDGTVLASATCSFRATFSTTQANFAWQENGIFNSTSDGVGRMLNRRLEAYGTKTNDRIRQLTQELTLA